MGCNRHQDDHRIRRITWVGLWGNLALSAVKVTVGLLAGSLALVADGFHSLSDIATDLAVILGVHFGGKAPDPKHPYGHGRMETFSAAFVAVVLGGVGIGMIYKAGAAIAIGPRQAGSTLACTAVVVVAALSIAIKELLYRWTLHVAIATQSTALYANAWHHRSDALSSIAVLVGTVSVKFGYRYGDELAAIAVGLMILLVAVRIIGGCFHELSERAVDRETLAQIERILQTDDGIHQWHQLRTRSVGREIFIDLHILVDPDLTITEAHRISDAFERELHEQIDRPVNVVVHVEPDTPELRKSSE